MKQTNCKHCLHWQEKYDNVGICFLERKVKQSFEECEFFKHNSEGEFTFEEINNEEE